MNEAILSKIKKLLTLGADNENENEGAAALKKAAKLAGQHGISIANVDIRTNEVTVDNTTIAASNKRNQAWEAQLTGLIAYCFDCKVIYQTSSFTSNWLFFGMTEDLNLALWYFKYLRLRIIRIGKNKFPLVKDQKSYGIGAVTGLRPRLINNFYKEKQKFESTDTKALVVIKKEQIAETVHKAFPRSCPLKLSAPKINRNAYNTGHIDGSSMPLSRGHITA